MNTKRVRNSIMINLKTIKSIIFIRFPCIGLIYLLYRHVRYFVKETL